MIKRLIYTFGSNVEKSWQTFRCGLVVFVAGALLIFAGAYWWIWFQIPAVILLVIGAALAAKGYMGILANRFSKVLNELKPDVDIKNKNTPPKSRREPT